MLFSTRRRATVGVLVSLALLATAGCSDADATNQPQPPKTGGTLHVIVSAKPAHLDPQRIATATDANVSRLLSRTLTTFKSEPGAAASEIVGDLATDAGRPSEGNRVWDFRLKEGLRWEDGTPITCEDVKYGVERSFSSAFSVAQPYAKTYLASTENYAGPFVDGNNDGKGLASVQCADKRNIKFRLSQPVGDFGYTVAMSVFAPVPVKQDTKNDYDRKPFSNGPYKLQENTDQRLVFVRNQYWDRKTDSVRKAYPEKIVIEANGDLPTVTSNLIQSEGDFADSIDLDKNVAPSFVQQVVNDPDLSARAVQGSYGGIRYLAINSKRIPDLDCRRALVYAFDKRKFRAAAGGSVFGDYANTMIAPQLKAHKDFDLYDSANNVEGKPDVAVKLMEGRRNSGKPCATTLTLSIPEQKDIRRLAATMVESYQRIGIQLKVNGIDPESYFDVIGNPANQNDLLWAGWIPDWANGSAVIPPLFDGRLIPTKADATNNQNYSLLNDRQINDAIAAALEESMPDRQYRLWGELDEKIQQQAVTIPIIYMKALRMAGTNVRGGFIHPQFGQPDLCALGLA
ncbi:ABC transporter substrate-binding protein [Dactylosporangium roseum]|uniref:ABC transporter substrate-binding protein n=1 Tax=Dactylosporangium roseum TaxID=47989 RepID=A0ABY5Z9V8_9ACTN|nr:ABC transporter substrate-binding protein [Dactylosporangium roseum]UWZ38449.1 ABC transporter substrate-binding protein [Dactylosporangium roseum]